VPSGECFIFCNGRAIGGRRVVGGNLGARDSGVLCFFF
jgi:hypothetical protein